MVEAASSLGTSSWDSGGGVGTSNGATSAPGVGVRGGIVVGEASTVGIGLSAGGGADTLGGGAGTVVGGVDKLGCTVG